MSYVIYNIWIPDQLVLSPQDQCIQRFPIPSNPSTYSYQHLRCVYFHFAQNNLILTKECVWYWSLCKGQGNPCWQPKECTPPIRTLLPQRVCVTSWMTNSKKSFTNYPFPQLISLLLSFVIDFLGYTYTSHNALMFSSNVYKELMSAFSWLIVLIKYCVKDTLWSLFAFPKISHAIGCCILLIMRSKGCDQ